MLLHKPAFSLKIHEFSVENQQKTKHILYYCALLSTIITL